MYMNYITFIAMSKIKPEQLIGEVQEETENYDLMSVVMICLGKPGTENHKGIEATGTYSDTITLPDGGNYIGIECENFTGNIELTTLIISKKPGNTGISRDIRTEFTTDLLLSD